MSDPMTAAGDRGPDGRRRCSGRSKQTGEPCKQPPVPGAGVCRFHGGAAPQVRAAAERRALEARAAALATTYGLPVEIDPVDALLGELWRTQGAVMWLQAQIADLTPEEVGWGKTEVKQVNSSEFGGTDTTEAAAINILVQLYQQERAHLAKVSRDCVAVKVELSMQRRMDAIAADVMAKLAIILRALGHDPEDRDVLRLVVNVLRGMPPELEAASA